MTLALHILTLRDGEVYLHHFWLLIVLAFLIFSGGASSRGGK